MRTGKDSEEQIIGFLRQAEAGMPAREIGRKYGFSDASFYKWRSKYGGMDATEAKRLRELERRTASSSAFWPRRAWTSTRPRAYLAQNSSFKR